MKGINLQFDTLLQFIEKNSSNQDMLKSRDSFEIVYEKITQEAMKIVALVFDNLIDDHTLKLSFTKLSRQLKAFLALKPAAQEEQDDYFNHEFDQVQQFMNNRKPVMAEVDNSQRGDIVKFLFQAENKEKDIEQFMGNIKNIGGLGNVVRKLRTLKNIAVITEDIETQTNMTMGYFERLEKRMPTLFKLEESTVKCNGQQMGGSSGQQNSSQVAAFDLDAQIDQMIKQKVKQAQELAQAQQQQKQKQKQRQKQKQKTKSQKQQQQAKKKKQPQKRNSEAPNNGKRNSIVASPFKTKSGFGNDKMGKKGLIAIVEEKDNKKEKKTAANSTANSAQRFQANGGKNQGSAGNSQGIIDSVRDTAKIQSAMPSFEHIFSTLVGVKGIEGISEEQIKIIYESIKSSATQSLLKSQIFAKPITLQKECNTSLTYTCDVVTDEKGNIINGSYQNETSIKRKKGKNFQQSNSGNLTGEKGESSHMSIDEEDEQMDETMQARFRSKSKKIKHDGQLNRSMPIDLLIKQQAENSGIDQDHGDNQTRSGLPNISKHTDAEIMNKHEKSDSTNMLLKEGKSAEEFLRKLKDSKYLKPFNQSRSINKENYTLDMYKSKLQTKNRASQHTNLPSLGRNSSNPKYGISLHQDGLKSPYLKKTTNLSSNDPLFPSTYTQSQGFFKKGQKGDKAKQMSKQQQKIMKQLQRIVKDGAVKSHMKHIAMYIQFVESVHVRKCGERCIHLERFYQFLRKNNLPNRKELILHRTDMNVNEEI